MLFGHGPGPSSLLSGPAEAFALVDDPDANLASWLHQPQADPVTAALAPVAVNLLGAVEHPELGATPYRVNQDGQPYVPVGDGGIVLGLQLGDPVSGAASDHAAPGACLVHPDPAARHALATYACIGNPADGADRRGGRRPRRGARQARRGGPGHRGLRAGRPGPDAPRRTR